MAQRRFATSIDEIHEKFKHFRTEEGKAVEKAFVPKPTDIFISPFPKSGTTWTQQIVHSLRTRGDMDFDDIMEVVPWLSMAHDHGIDPNAPQKATPRVFKSHGKWHEVPRGTRYIYVIRDPKDVIVSDYHFLGGWIFDMDAVSIREFADDFLLKDNNYWRHVESWWDQFDNPDVLFLCFEEMRADLDTAIRQIASFMHITLDDDLFEIVRRNASFEFMKAHQDKFNDQITRKHRNDAMNLPATAKTVIVKDGKVGSHQQQLPPDLITEIESRWKTATNPDYGLTSYDAVRKKVGARGVI